MNIIVVGAGIIGQNLTKRLSEQKHDVTLIDKNKKQCNTLAEELNAAIICGDATQIDILEEANLDKADVLATVTESDETNLLVCLIAKEHKEDIRLASRISNDVYRRIFLKNDITTLISPELSGVDMLEQMIIEPDLFRFMPHHGGRFEMLEMSVSKESKAVGLNVKQLERKKDLRIIAIKKRKKEFRLVDDSIVIDSGDVLIVAVYKDSEKAFKKLLQ